MSQTLVGRLGQRSEKRVEILPASGAPIVLSLQPGRIQWEMAELFAQGGLLAFQVHSDAVGQELVAIGPVASAEAESSAPSPLEDSERRKPESRGGWGWAAAILATMGLGWLGLGSRFMPRMRGSLKKRLFDNPPEQK